MPKNILTDAVIEFTEYNSYRKYPEKLCLVKFYDEEQGREFAFLTNAFHITAPEIANLYKNRWQIERRDTVLELGVSLLEVRHVLLPIRIVTTVYLKTLRSMLWSRQERNV